MDFNLTKINETTRRILKENQAEAKTDGIPVAVDGGGVVNISSKPIEQLLLDKQIQEQADMLFETMTRKHFQNVADTLKAIEDPKKRQELADHHAAIFKQSNPLFKADLFHKAAGTQPRQN